MNDIETGIRSTLRKAGRMAMAGVAALGVAAFGAANFSQPAQAEEWPDQPISIVVPFKAGGSADRLARSLAEHMSPRLNTPITIENRPGGSGGLGAAYFMQQPADGHTLLAMQATPYLANAILVGGAPVKWEDFSLLNAQWNDYGIIAVHKDSPYQTLEELVNAMREPGKVSSGIINGNGGHIQTLIMLKELGIPAENIRFVTYNGGAPLRTALAGNQVDFEITAAQGANSIMDNLRVLALVNDSDPDNLNAPLLNDELKNSAQIPFPSSAATSLASSPTPT